MSNKAALLEKHNLTEDQILEIHTTDRRISYAWAAGFFEGEGSVVCYDKKWRSIISRIVQVNLQPLEMFQTAIGVGKIQGPYANGHRQDYYSWTLYGYEGVQYLTCLLWAGLSDKRRRQFADALAAYVAYKNKLKVPKWKKCVAAGHETYKYGPRQRCRTCARAYLRKYRADKKAGIR